jgi:Tol biopolymer transport system component
LGTGLQQGEGENSDIYVVNADGSRVRRLTHNRTSESLPGWQPG